jgi:predicted nuclease of restriction endonuclease-like RecB superfamily
MLPSALLAVWKRKGEIQPRYAKLSADNLQVANELINAYKNHVGEKKSTLKAVVTNLENQGYEYRFVRGLALLLDRRGTSLLNSKITLLIYGRILFAATQNA